MTKTTLARLRKFKHRTLVRKVQDLQSLAAEQEAVIERHTGRIVDLTESLARSEKANTHDVKDAVERIQKMRDRARVEREELEMQRDEWRTIAYDEGAARLDTEHAFQTAMMRQKESERGDAFGVVQRRRIDSLVKPKTEAAVSTATQEHHG